MMPLWILLFAVLQIPDTSGEPPPRKVTIATSNAEGMRMAEWLIADMQSRQMRDPSWQIMGVEVLANQTALWQAWLEQESADVVIVLGVAGLLAATDPTFKMPVPVIGGFFHDPSLFDLNYTDLGRSGKADLNFVIPAPRLKRELETFKGVLSGSSVGVIMDPALSDLVPGLQAKVQSTGSSLGLDITWLKPGRAPFEALKTATSELDGVFLGPLAHLTPRERQTLLNVLTQWGLPTYAMGGLEEVRQGAFGGSARDPRRKLVKRLVDHLVAFAGGESLDQLPAYLPLRDALTIHGGTARALNYPMTLQTKILADIQFEDAEFMNPNPRFRDVIDLGLANNPELQAQKYAAEAAHFQKKAALGSWLPQVNADSQMIRNNGDNPLIAAGLSAETQTQLVISGRQVLFDEATLAQTRIAKWEWQKQVAQFDQRTQETLQALAFAYLNLGIERQLLEVDLENLKLTRSNLQVARSRVQLGAAGLEEQLRWESLEARQLGQTHASQARLESAKASLERLVGVPLSLPLHARPLGLQQEDTLFLNETWEQLMQQAGESLTQALEEMALARSSTVMSSDLQTKITRRRFTQSKRHFYLPSLSLNASVTDVLDQEFQPRMGDGPGFSLQQDGLNWNVTLQASIPLFQGGRRLQQLGAARANHRSAQQMLKASKLGSREKVRRALATFTGSKPNVSLTALAADRARQSLEIVLEKYEQGSASILDIQQAQEQAMAQQRQAAIAEYNHGANLIELQASLSFFDWRLSPQQRQQWLSALKAKIRQPSTINSEKHEEAYP